MNSLLRKNFKLFKPKTKLNSILRVNMGVNISTLENDGTVEIQNLPNNEHRILFQTDYQFQKNGDANYAVNLVDNNTSKGSDLKIVEIDGNSKVFTVISDDISLFYYPDKDHMVTIKNFTIDTNDNTFNFRGIVFSEYNYSGDRENFSAIARYFTFENCHVRGMHISAGYGGMVGKGGGNNNGKIIINGCSCTTGTTHVAPKLGNSAGGLCGQENATSGQVIIYGSYCNLNTSDGSGGLIGRRAAFCQDHNEPGSVTIVACYYNASLIEGSNSGGFFGTSAGRGGGLCTIIGSYVNTSISSSADNGGGFFSNYVNNGAKILCIGCYSEVNIDTSDNTPNGSYMGVTNDSNVAFACCWSKNSVKIGNGTTVLDVHDGTNDVDLQTKIMRTFFKVAPWEAYYEIFIDENQFLLNGDNQSGKNYKIPNTNDNIFALYNYVYSNTNQLSFDDIVTLVITPVSTPILSTGFMVSGVSRANTEQGSIDNIEMYVESTIDVLYNDDGFTFLEIYELGQTLQEIKTFVDNQSISYNTVIADLHPTVTVENIVSTFGTTDNVLLTLIIDSADFTVLKNYFTDAEIVYQSLVGANIDYSVLEQHFDTGLIIFTAYNDAGTSISVLEGHYSHSIIAWSIYDETSPPINSIPSLEEDFTSFEIIQYISEPGRLSILQLKNNARTDFTSTEIIQALYTYTYPDGSSGLNYLLGGFNAKVIGDTVNDVSSVIHYMMETYLSGTNFERFDLLVTTHNFSFSEVRIAAPGTSQYSIVLLVDFVSSSENSTSTTIADLLIDEGFNMTQINNSVGTNNGFDTVDMILGLLGTPGGNGYTYYQMYDTLYISIEDIVLAVGETHAGTTITIDSIITSIHNNDQANVQPLKTALSGVYTNSLLQYLETKYTYFELIGFNFTMSELETALDDDQIILGMYSEQSGSNIATVELLKVYTITRILQGIANEPNTSTRNYYNGLLSQYLGSSGTSAQVLELYNEQYTIFEIYEIGFNIQIIKSGLSVSNTEIAYQLYDEGVGVAELNGNFSTVEVADAMRQKDGTGFVNIAIYMNYLFSIGANYASLFNTVDSNNNQIFTKDEFVYLANSSVTNSIKNLNDQGILLIELDTFGYTSMEITTAMNTYGNIVEKTILFVYLTQQFPTLTDVIDVYGFQYSDVINVYDHIIELKNINPNDTIQNVEVNTLVSNSNGIHEILDTFTTRKIEIIQTLMNTDLLVNTTVDTKIKELIEEYDVTPKELKDSATGNNGFTISAIIQRIDSGVVGHDLISILTIPSIETQYFNLTEVKNALNSSDNDIIKTIFLRTSATNASEILNNDYDISTIKTGIETEENETSKQQWRQGLLDYAISEYPYTIVEILNNGFTFDELINLDYNTLEAIYEQYTSVEVSSIRYRSLIEQNQKTIIIEALDNLNISKNQVIDALLYDEYTFITIIGSNLGILLNDVVSYVGYSSTLTNSIATEEVLILEFYQQAETTTTNVLLELYDVSQIRNAINTETNPSLSTQYTITLINDLYDTNVSVTTLLDIHDFTIAEIKSAFDGNTNRTSELVQHLYDTNVLLTTLLDTHGFTIAEVKTAFDGNSTTTSELINHLYDANVGTLLDTHGFTIAEVKSAFDGNSTTTSELINHLYNTNVGTLLDTHGFTIAEVKSAFDGNSTSTSELINHLYDANVGTLLDTHGFTIAEVKSAFDGNSTTTSELINHLYDTNEANLFELFDIGFNISEMKATFQNNLILQLYQEASGTSRSASEKLLGSGGFTIFEINTELVGNEIYVSQLIEHLYETKSFSELEVDFTLLEIKVAFENSSTDTSAYINHLFLTQTIPELELNFTFEEIKTAFSSVLSNTLAFINYLYDGGTTLSELEGDFQIQVIKEAFTSDTGKTSGLIHYLLFLRIPQLTEGVIQENYNFTNAEISAMKELYNIEEVFTLDTNSNNKKLNLNNVVNIFDTSWTPFDLSNQSYSELETIDGKNNYITLFGSNQIESLFQYDGTKDITVKNMRIIADSTFSGKFKGIVKTNFISSNKRINFENCTIECDIEDGMGSLISVNGNFRNVGEEQTIVTIAGCHHIGALGINSGGLVGSNFGGRIIVKGCFHENTDNNDGEGSGGIVGAEAHGKICVIGCGSSSNIPEYGGGIIGRITISTEGVVAVVASYSSGSLSNYSGGIFGSISENVGTKCLALACYSDATNNPTNAGSIIGWNQTSTDIDNAISIGCYGNITNHGISIFSYINDSFVVHSNTTNVNLSNIDHIFNDTYQDKKKLIFFTAYPWSPDSANTSAVRMLDWNSLDNTNNFFDDFFNHHFSNNAMVLYSNAIHSSIILDDDTEINSFFSSVSTDNFIPTIETAKLFVRRLSTNTLKFLSHVNNSYQQNNVSIHSVVKTPVIVEFVINRNILDPFGTTVQDETLKNLYIDRFSFQSGGGVGDPYITTLNGYRYKLPNRFATYRLAQITLLDDLMVIINVEVSKLSNEEINRLRSFLPNHNHVIETNGYYFNKFYIEFQDVSLLFDRNLFLTDYKSKQDLLSRKDIFIQMDKNYRKVKHSYLGESMMRKMTIIIQNRVKIVLQHYTNPQIINGINVHTNSRQTLGLIQHGVHPKHYRLKKITSNKIFSLPKNMKKYQKLVRENFIIC